jgi:hypothetical protein
MFLKKKSKKETLQRHRLGNFELRISEVKVEIEDVVHRLSKHVYNIGGYEYGLILFLLSQTKQTENGVVYKTEQEIKDGLSNVAFLVSMLAHTNLIFSNEGFRQSYYDLVKDVIISQQPKEVDKSKDEEMIKEIETVEQMRESV